MVLFIYIRTLWFLVSDRNNFWSWLVTDHIEEAWSLIEKLLEQVSVHKEGFGVSETQLLEKVSIHIEGSWSLIDTIVSK